MVAFTVPRPPNKVTEVTQIFTRISFRQVRKTECNNKTKLKNKGYTNVYVKKCDCCSAIKLYALDEHNSLSYGKEKLQRVHENVNRKIQTVK